MLVGSVPPDHLSAAPLQYNFMSRIGKQPIAIPPKVKDRIVSTIPLRRFARPEEIARAALFVLQNDYYDGRILEIDGGLRL